MTPRSALAADPGPGVRPIHRSPAQLIADSPPPVQVAAGLLAIGAGTAGLLLQPADHAPGALAMTSAVALTFSPLGALLVRRADQGLLGRLMLGLGLTSGLAALAICWSGATLAAWLSQWLWWPPLVTIPVILLFFPDAQLPSPRWRALAVVLVAAGAATALALALAAVTAPRTLLTTLEPPTPTGRLLAQLAAFGVALVLACTVGVLASLAVRWRAAPPAVRRQLVCLAPAAVLFVAAVLLDYLNVPGAWVAAVVTLPFGLTVAILQYQFSDLDLYINRGLIWLIMTGIAIGLFVLALFVGTVIFRSLSITAPTWAGTVLAGSVVAVALLPAERLAQRAVRRLLYGRRDEPYAILSDIGRYAERMEDPLAVLPRLAASVVDSLRVPYVELTVVADHEEAPIVIAHGRPTGAMEPFAMLAHGVEIGQLGVAPRHAGARFSASEIQLLRELAGQAAVAAEAVRSTLQLQRARERLVFAREEERRRLRRDLHDGVASTVVAARMTAAAAQQLLGPDQPVSQVLGGLARNLEACGAEVRGMIEGLGPAALDGGLGPALRDLVERTSGSGVPTVLELPDQLAALPAAVEVVAYRLVTEAVTNVLKHASATRCTVRLMRRERWLDVEVIDDGVGIAVDHLADRPTRGGGPARDAVGLGSLRSRAAEIGGRLDITSCPGRTVIHATLPSAPLLSGTETEQPIPSDPEPATPRLLTANERFSK